MYFVFLCFYKNAINITNKKKRKIPLAKIDVSYIFSISKKRYVAKSEFLKRCMFRFSRFYFVKEMYVTISGKMSKNFRKIQQKYEKAPLFC